MRYFAHLLFLLFFFVNSVNAQNLLEANCKKGQYVYLLKDGQITFPTADSLLLKDREGNFIQFYEEVMPNSKWYVFQFFTDASIEVVFRPDQSQGMLDYYLYSVDAAEKVCSMASLSNFVKSGSIKSDMDNMVESGNFKIDGREGNRFMLNISTISENGCGHEIEFSSGDQRHKVRAVRRDCFSEPAQVIKGFPLRQAMQMPKSKFVSLNVYDKERQVQLGGEVLLVDRKARSKSPIYFSEKGDEQFEIHRGVNYQLKINVSGYKSRIIELDSTQYADLESISVDLERLGPGDKFELKNIYFFPNTYAIRSESVPELERLVEYLNAYPTMKISIEGHSNGRASVKADPDKVDLGYGWDFSGNEKQLSKLRAEAVVRYLEMSGISNDRMKIKGWGAKKMLYEHPRTQAQRDANKRVEIVLLSL